MREDELLMNAEEVAKVMRIAKSTAYKVIQRMNAELEEKGFLTIGGKIDRKFFYDHFYGTREEGR